MKTLGTSVIRIGISALLMASLLSFEFASASGPTCSLVFSEQNSIDRTIHDLAAMRISLDLAKSSGTNSIELTALTSDYRKKEKSFVEYLETNKVMTRQELAEVLKQEIQKIQNENQSDQKKENRQRREQAEQLKISVIDGKYAVLHRVEPGSFKMGEAGGKQVDVTLTKPFEMQATTTTQIIWKTVADLAARTFPGKYQINADPSLMTGDTLPVERVSFKEVQTWIKALNELSAMGEPALADLIPGHKKGDVYRLPTEAEWEFVVRGRGQYNDDYHFGNDLFRLEEHAWYNGNSFHQTHPVAQKKSLVIDSKDFYDMHGNVWEWTQDFFLHDPPGGVDPQGPSSGTYRVLRGGSWGSVKGDTRSAIRFSSERFGADSNTISSSAIGFRLVRTVR